jgi:pimeloyl-ACP methyl ester carboxylesterase
MRRGASLSMAPGTPVEDHRVSTNGVELHVVQAGPREGEVALCLHGFPEFWMGWRNQIGPLAAAGYRVWCPDQRGYNTSDKPAGAGAYSLDVLVEDVRGLVEASGGRQVCLLGHDWGGAVAWLFANRYPELVRRLVIVNSPHFSVMRQQMRTNPAQRKRSWYIFFFQIPWLPERLLAAGNYRRLARGLRGTSRRGTFPDELLESYREAWRRPGALTATVNWYRALLRARGQRVKDRRIRVPTLLIWGTRDTALGRELAQPSIDYCDDGRLEFIEGAGHWVLHEEPEKTSRLICEFLQRT